MHKIDLIKEIEKSKIQLKEHISKNNIDKKGITQIIHKIIEGEPYEVQVATNLHYIEGLNTEEIAHVTNQSEITILNYFQFILFKIKLILDIDTKKENKFSTSNYSGKGQSNTLDLDKGTLFDSKS